MYVSEYICLYCRAPLILKSIELPHVTLTSIICGINGCQNVKVTIKRFGTLKRIGGWYWPKLCVGERVGVRPCTGKKSVVQWQ